MEEELVPAEAAEEVQVETPAEPVEDQVAQEGQEPVVDEPVEEPPKKKETAQEMANRLTKARREAEREAAYWRKVALEKEKSEKQFEKPIEPKSDFPPRPTLDQFDTTEEYDDAVYEWRKEKEQKQTAISRQREAEQEALKNFNIRAKELRAVYDDFDEVVEAPVFSPIMRTVIANSEHGPELAYFLGKPENHDTAKKIYNLPLEMQPYELAKLESKLLVAKQTKKVPSAPKPISPVGISGGSSEPDTEKMSMEEWMEWDKQRTLEKLKARYG